MQQSSAVITYFNGGIRSFSVQALTMNKRGATNARLDGVSNESAWPLLGACRPLDLEALHENLFRNSLLNPTLLS